jgi:hypothetical protein
VSRRKCKHCGRFNDYVLSVTLADGDVRSTLRILRTAIDELLEAGK